MTIQDKLNRLREIVKQCRSAVVAFSGGADSSLLAKVAFDSLGQQALAVTAVSPSLPKREREEAARIAREIGIPHLLIESREMNDQRFTENSFERCYFCKSELFERLQEIADEKGFQSILYGGNFDDESDFRPGSKAALRSGGKAPLREALLTKEEIRIVSKELGLSTWDKPAMACLASRIPFGEEITLQKLRQIESAEEALAGMGFRQFRVRHHGEVARIELGADEIDRIADPMVRRKMIDHVRKAGFKFITADLEGYRTGPFNPDKEEL